MITSPPRNNADPTTLPVLEGHQDFGTVTDTIASIPLSRFGPRYWIAVVVSASIALCGGVAILILLYQGPGVWGVNQPVGWGFAIVNFVWWIGIGHAGTLISAILLLLKQPWRNSINRFAEAMTLFAVIQAGMFPLLHLGRWWKFFYLLPYPNQMTVWPQWRSPLVWDAFAVATYFTVSLLFWYLGLVPDLATMRDTAHTPWVKRVLHVAALGWRGSAIHWHRLQTSYLLLAGLATPLVVSVHSIVSLDFAVSLVPGWNATIFPPFFVAGAIYSGFAMVLTLAIPLRTFLNLRDIVTPRHLDLMAKVMLCTGLIVGYGYMMEVLTEWLSTEPAERFRLHSRLVGNGAITFWGTVLCNVVVGQTLWFRAVRTRPLVLFFVALTINTGMWLERFDIVVNSLERDYMPSMWGRYVPTSYDWATFAGTLGLFATLFLLFIRLLPLAPMYELRELVHHGRRHRAHEPSDRNPGSPRSFGTEGVQPASLPEHAPWPTPAQAPTQHEASPSIGRATPLGLAAAFSSPEALTEGVRTVRAAGFSKLEAYTPMPIDGLALDMGRSHTLLPLATLLGGLIGGTAGYTFMYWTAVRNYPWIAGGKPLHAWPAFIPVTFEMTVLGASLTAFLGVWIACRLPRLHHPVFDAPGFERATRDRFFLWIDAKDPRFDEVRTEALLASLGPDDITAAHGGAT